jgi:alpha-mannosidase
VSYALIPHTGTWQDARISRENCCWNEPLLAEIVDGQSADTAPRSLVTVSGTGIEISALLMQERNMLVRLFNGEGDDSERTVSLHVRPSKVQLVELDGRPIQQLDVRRGSGGRYEVRLALPRFGIRTLRCELAS